MILVYLLPGPSLSEGHVEGDKPADEALWRRGGREGE